MLGRGSVNSVPPTTRTSPVKNQRINLFAHVKPLFAEDTLPENLLRACFNVRISNGLVQTDAVHLPDQIMRNHTANQSARIAVYFDGGCPMCAKEIAYYQRLDRQQRVEWIDVAGPNPSCPIGYDQQALLARFHVKDLTTGQIYDGAAGFARLWRDMPTPWRELGAVASFAPVTWLLEIGYRLTLKVRPMLVKRFFKST